MEVFAPLERMINGATGEGHGDGYGPYELAIYQGLGHHADSGTEWKCHLDGDLVPIPLCLCSQVRYCL